MKNKITTISGSIFTIASLAAQSGIHFGHIGSVDGVQAIAGVAGLIFAWYAKDKATQPTSVSQ